MCIKKELQVAVIVPPVHTGPEVTHDGAQLQSQPVVQNSILMFSQIK